MTTIELVRDSGRYVDLTHRKHARRYSWLREVRTWRLRRVAPKHRANGDRS